MFAREAEQNHFFRPSILQINIKNYSIYLKLYWLNVTRKKQQISIKSRTYKHNETAKFKQGLISADKTSQGFNSYCDRHNFEIGKFKLMKRLLIEKILKRVENE